MVVSKLVPIGIAAVIAVSTVGLIMQRNQLEASNTRMQQQLRDASMPELPVAVGFRGALLGPGRVVRVENLAGTDIAVQAQVIDAASHHERDFTWSINRGFTAEFGHAQGYAFEPGDQLTLAHDGFKSKTWIVR
jgi:hypothetical protein